jgi:hypothetical protein
MQSRGSRKSILTRGGNSPPLISPTVSVQEATDTVPGELLDELFHKSAK